MPFALVTPDINLAMTLLAFGLDLGSTNLGSSNFGNTAVYPAA